MTLQEAIDQGKISGGGGNVVVDYNNCYNADTAWGAFDDLDGGPHGPTDTWNVQCPDNSVMVAVWDDNDNMDTLNDIKCCPLKLE